MLPVVWNVRIFQIVPNVDRVYFYQMAFVMFESRFFIQNFLIDYYDSELDDEN